MENYQARKTPCVSCPYRKDTPSGIWDETEYIKLTQYDGDLPEQSPRLFMCHKTGRELCSGWVGHKDYPADLLALRLAAIRGEIDTAQVFDYSTDVPLYRSGLEAYRAGIEDIENPGDEAREAVEKIRKIQEINGVAELSRDDRGD